MPVSSVQDLENKVIKKKKIDKELTLRVMQNKAMGRIFVEFTSKDGKLVVQRGFQDNYDGNQLALAFQETFKSIKAFKEYLGIK